MSSLTDSNGDALPLIGCHTTFCLNSQQRPPPSTTATDSSQATPKLQTRIPPVTLKAHVDVKNMTQAVCCVLALGQ